MRQSKIRRYLKHGMLPQLRAFEAVTRHGSFTRAAEELCMAQPTVSIHIKKLTETIGLPLIEQTGRHVHPTAAGRELYAACQGIFKTLADVEDTLADIRGLRAGSLRIATGTAGKHLVPRLLAHYVKAHAGIEVSLHISRRGALLERLNHHMDDLYVLVNPPTGDDVVVHRILPNPLVVLARADHPLACCHDIPFARLAQEPFLMREPGSGTRLATERIFAGHGVKPRIGMELGSDEAVKETVLAGLGVACLYRHSLGLDLHLDGLAQLDVHGFPVAAHWYMVHPSGKALPLLVQAFIEFVHHEAERIVRACTRYDTERVSHPFSAVDAA